MIVNHVTLQMKAKSIGYVNDRDIQASGFEGPIPSSISILKNLTEL